MTVARELEARLAELDGIGRDAVTGAVTRLAWTAEDDALGAWFARRAAAAGLRVERDHAGNRWAVPETPPPWWGVGSHLDSVRGGGALDGPLGVAAGFAVAERARAPVAVISFADEEGARFNTPTFGSRALAGSLDVAGVLRRRDRDGVTLGEALRSAGLEPAALATATARRERLRGFLELHIDQGTQVAGLVTPFAVARGLAARARLRCTFGGRADHAGTTAPPDRRDALAAAAELVVAVEALAGDGVRATVGRMDVVPNAATTIASRCVAWVDVRGHDDGALATAVERVEDAARAAAGRRGVAIDAVEESRSPAVTFAPGLRDALGGPEVTCWAGHDSGILAAHLPAALVLVRNRTGVSHAPEEHVELEDAAAGVDALVRALEAVA
jgi:beta-ureidopropionase / N-carbamoyl-L-amino-acid hydrolase